MRILISAALLFVSVCMASANEIHIRQLGLVLAPANYQYPEAAQASPYNLERSQTFMRVIAIDANSPLFLAGLQPGDMVTDIYLSSQGVRRGISSRSFKYHDEPGRAFYEILNNLQSGGSFRVELEVDYEWEVSGVKLYTKEYAFSGAYEPFEEGEMISTPVFDATTAEFSFGEPWEIRRDDHPLLASAREAVKQRSKAVVEQPAEYEGCERIRFGDKDFYVGYTDQYFHHDYDGSGRTVFNTAAGECEGPQNVISNVFSVRRNVASFGASNNDVLYVLGDICSETLHLVGFHTEDTLNFFSTIFDPNFYKTAYLNKEGSFELTSRHMRAYYDRYDFERLEEVITIRPHQYFEFLSGKEFAEIPRNGFLLDSDLSNPDEVWSAVTQSYATAVNVRERICETPLAQVTMEARIAVQAGYFMPTARERGLAGLDSDGYLSFLLTSFTLDLVTGRLVALDGASISSFDFFREIERYRRQQGVRDDITRMFEDALNNGGAVIAGAAFVSLLSGAIGGEVARRQGCNSYMAFDMGIECMFVD